MSTMSHNSDSHKDPSTLEEEAQQVRNRLGHNIDELGHRLSPGDLLDQAIGMAGEHGGEFSRNLGTQLKNNPVPLLLTGVGLTWLIAASNRPPRSQEYWDRSQSLPAPDTTYDEYDEYVVQPESQSYGDTEDTSLTAKARHKARTAKSRLKSARDGLSARARSARDRVQSAQSGASQKAGAARDKISEQAQSARSTMSRAGERIEHRGQDAYRATRAGAENVSDSFHRLMEDQPLLVGALGVALGAALGGLLPHTRQEDKLMGEQRERLLEKGKAFAAEKYDEVREGVTRTAQNVEASVKESASNASGRTESDTPSATQGANSGGNAPRPSSPAQPSPGNSPSSQP